MRFSAALVALLTVGFSTARSTLHRERAVILEDDRKVPGNSPLELCDKDHADDILEITSVDLAPNPPKAGNTLLIKATGLVKQQINKGAYINLTVKYGLIRLVQTTADLCETIENVDLECPLDKGIMSIVKEVDLPEQIPPGTYTVFADVYSENAEPITCLTATVKFERQALSTPWGDL